MESKRFASVWDAIEDTPHAAASMKARSTLMMELSSYIEGHGLTQAQAADLLGVTQPWVSDLVRGKIDLFSFFRHGHQCRYARWVKHPSCFVSAGTQHRDCEKVFKLYNGCVSHHRLPKITIDEPSSGGKPRLMCRW